MDTREVAPLNLRAAEARHKETMNGFSSDPGAYVESAADVPALLAHCRALRAALAPFADAYRATQDGRTPSVELGSAFERAARVLAQATDREGT